MVVPQKLTCPLKNDGWKTIFLLKQSRLRDIRQFSGDKLFANPVHAYDQRILLLTIAATSSLVKRKN